MTAEDLLCRIKSIMAKAENGRRLGPADARRELLAVINAALKEAYDQGKHDGTHQFVDW